MDANALMALTILAMLVRGGHAAHTIGAVRARSVADAAIRAALGSASVILAMYLLGRALALVGASGETGNVEGAGVFFTSPTSLLGVFMVALIPSAIVEAATAERMRVVSGVLAATLVVLFGWAATVAIGWAILRLFSANQQAISAIWPLAAAHVVGGVAGIVAARTLGPRAAKYNRDGSANFIPPHHLGAIVTGDAMLIVGLPVMAGVVAGEATARVVDALLAAAAASIAAAAVTSARDRRIDVMLLTASAVCGAIVGSLTVPDLQWLSISLGAAAGAILPIAAIKLDLKFRVDDPTGLAMIHLLGGVLGTAGASVVAMSFAWRALIGSVVAAVGLTIVAIVVSAIVTRIAMLVARRVPTDAESEGVDLAIHDVNAYPDFQQTMIKSYHLRQ